MAAQRNRSRAVKEEWRSVVGYEGFYEVSSAGNIRRITKGKGVKTNRILTGWIGSSGYRQIYLTDANKHPSPKLVHRIVAEAFLGSSDGKQVNHKNLVKLDNDFRNLEYVTPKENVAHAGYSGRYSPRKLTGDIAANIRRDILGGFTHVSIAEKYNIHLRTVWMVASGRSWNGRCRILKGEAHHASKLTEYDVREILCFKGKVSAPRLARRYGITSGTIYSIWKRSTWTSLS